MEFRCCLSLVIITIVLLSGNNKALDVAETVDEDVLDVLGDKDQYNLRSILPGSEGNSDAQRIKMFLELMKAGCKVYLALDETQQGLHLTEQAIGDILKDPVKNLGGGVDKTTKGAHQMLSGAGHALGGVYGLGKDGVGYLKG